MYMFWLSLVIKCLLVSDAAIKCYSGTGFTFKEKECDMVNACLKKQLLGELAIRSCGSGTLFEEGCRTDGFTGTLTCSCTTNLCNTSSDMRPTKTFQLLMFILSLIAVPSYMNMTFL